MKTSLVFGVLAALCRSAFCLDNVLYQIGSASLSPSLVLTNNFDKASEAIDFEKNIRENDQLWNISASNEFPEYFEIHNNLGSYINCGTEEGTICSLTFDDPQSYKLERVSDNTYELVEKESGYFLLVNKDGLLQLAKWDQSLNEQFVFIDPQEEE